MRVAVPLAACAALAVVSICIIICSLQFCCVAVEEKLAHYNHKGYHSFQLHAVVDNDFLFLDAHVGMPGAMGDSTIWQDTDACKAIEKPSLDGWHGFLPPKGFIVVDQGYRLSPYQITPFARAQVGDRGKAVFNYYQSKARRCVEQAFGVIKKQYRILDGTHALPSSV